MKEGPQGRRGEVGTGDASSGRSGLGRVHPVSRARTHTRPPSLSISGPESPRLAARCAYSPLRVPGMSQWCPSQRHDSTALASLPRIGWGGEGACGGEKKGVGPGCSPD